MNSKCIGLQIWCNRKNIFSWQILQKLPSKKHKTHKTHHRLKKTFLGFSNFELGWKVIRHAKLFYILGSIVRKSQLLMFFPLKKISVLGQSYMRHFPHNRCFCCPAAKIRLAENLGKIIQFWEFANLWTKFRKKTYIRNLSLENSQKQAEHPENSNKSWKVFFSYCLSKNRFFRILSCHAPFLT